MHHFEGTMGKRPFYSDFRNESTEPVVYEKFSEPLPEYQLDAEEGKLQITFFCIESTILFFFRSNYK